ncbi:hypothetical protein I4U23_031257 [Adineta vaga]|nr:hypothetical protein I4U23_031257 [Adineta vaga]
MSDIYRNYSQRSTSQIQSSINNNEYEDYNRKGSKSSDDYRIQQTSNLDRKVYIGNIQTDQLTDRELVEFFKQFGKLSDIRVYQNYLFVQYENIHDAKNLIEQGQKSLILKGNQLDVLPAMEENKFCSLNSEESLTNRNSSRKRLSSEYDHQKKRICSRDENDLEIEYRMNSNQDKSPYTILIESNTLKECTDCQIILVNHRQKNYSEEISNYLRNQGLTTSVILIRENYSLNKAIANAIQEKYLYGIILMPMHEDKHLASFQILHGDRQEHRNLRLEDAYKIILDDYFRYKNQQMNCRLTIDNKYPLSMLLCLLADGRQLTLNEIDRILVYLFEKKANMLKLPQGTLPPLPSHYSNHEQHLNFIQNKCSFDTKDNSSIVIEQIFNSKSYEDIPSYSQLNRHSFSIPSLMSINQQEEFRNENLFI